MRALLVILALVGVALIGFGYWLPAAALFLGLASLVAFRFYRRADRERAELERLADLERIEDEREASLAAEYRRKFEK